jgi:hypothetical protein
MTGFQYQAFSDREGGSRKGVMGSSCSCLLQRAKYSSAAHDWSNVYLISSSSISLLLLFSSSRAFAVIKYPSIYQSIRHACAMTSKVQYYLHTKVFVFRVISLLTAAQAQSLCRNPSATNNGLTGSIDRYRSTPTPSIRSPARALLCTEPLH